MKYIKVLIVCISLSILNGCGGQQAQEPQSQPPGTQQSATQTPETTPPAVPQQEAAAPAVPAQKTEKQATASGQKTPAAAAAASRAPVAAAPAASAPAVEPAQGRQTAAAPQSQLAASAPMPAAPPQPKIVKVPGGTELGIRLQDVLDSGVNKTGDVFQAILDKDLIVDGQTVAARGSALVGKVVNVESAGRVQGRAAMSLTLTDLKTAGASYPIRTNILAFEAEDTVKKDATKVGLGAGIGAVVGAIAGGGKGAAIGAAVGGGAGAATVLATKGKEINFPAEHQFSFVLSNDLEVRLR